MMLLVMSYVLLAMSYVAAWVMGRNPIEQQIGPKKRHMHLDHVYTKSIRSSLADLALFHVDEDTPSSFNSLFSAHDSMVIGLILFRKDRLSSACLSLEPSHRVILPCCKCYELQ